MAVRGYAAVIGDDVLRKALRKSHLKEQKGDWRSVSDLLLSVFEWELADHEQTGSDEHIRSK